MPDNFFKLLLQDIANTLSLRLVGVSWKHSDKLVDKKVNILPKMHWYWLRFGFQLPKNLWLELTCKHFSCSKPISWGTIGIWPRHGICYEHMDYVRLKSYLPGVKKELWTYAIFVNSLLVAFFKVFFVIFFGPINQKFSISGINMCIEVY